MKKLVIIMAVACASIVSNATNIKWGSGAVQTPGEGGVLSGNKLTSASGYVLKMYAFESLSTIAYSNGDIYQWYKNGATDNFNELSAIVGNVNMTSSATMATATGLISPGEDGTTVYAAVLFVLEDQDGSAKWYLENAGQKASSKSTATLGNLALKVGGSGDATKWVSVPEPTSGLLMILGMAGLALRRRHA